MCLIALISIPPFSFLAAALFSLFFPFRLPYAGYFGGVSGLSKKQFLKINGFPNEYWGWGGEDDDIYNRCGCTLTVLWHVESSTFTFYTSHIFICEDTGTW